VTNATNVTAAGALMDSEVDADIKTLVLPASTTISAFGATLIDDAAASNARTTLGVVIGTDVAALTGTNAAEMLFVIPVGAPATDLTTGTGKVTWTFGPDAFTITDIGADVKTAPTGSILIADVNEAGTSIMTTNKLDIDVSETSTETAATAPGLTDTAIAANAIMSIDIDQVGSTIAGQELNVWIKGYWT
jgi:hypothetical protein